jgi:hypothetical protein
MPYPTPRVGVLSKSLIHYNRFQILYFGALGYFLFKLVRMYSRARRAAYLPARKSLTFFAVITIVLLVLTIINACVCTHNFGKGLKRYISRKKSTSGNDKPNVTEMSMMEGQVPSRMTID